MNAPLILIQNMMVLVRDLFFFIVSSFDTFAHLQIILKYLYSRMVLNGQQMLKEEYLQWYLEYLALLLKWMIRIHLLDLSIDITQLNFTGCVHVYNQRTVPLTSLFFHICLCFCRQTAEGSTSTVHGVKPPLPLLLLLLLLLSLSLSLSN